MLTTPLPGVDPRALCATLRELRAQILGADAGEGDPVARYFDWVTAALDALQTKVSPRDIDRLVLTRRYELLLSTTVDPDINEARASAVNGLYTSELDARAHDFADAYVSLERELDRWAQPEALVVLDTSVYLNHPDKLEHLDLAPHLQVREEPIRIIVPIVVIDELDNLKQQGRDTARWRAGYTLAVLDRVCTGTAQQGRLRDEDFTALEEGGIPRGEVTIEILFDPPGHLRLPINDDEIIDRALAVQHLAGRPVTLLTYDTGQSTRSRAAGQPVVKLTKPLPREPGISNNAS